MTINGYCWCERGHQGQIIVRCAGCCARRRAQAEHALSDARSAAESGALVPVPDAESAR